MLPFLDKKKIVSVINQRRGKLDTTINSEIEAPGSEVDEGLKECATDILNAIEHKSVIDLAKSLHAAFEYMEAMPHEEGPHLEEDEE